MLYRYLLILIAGAVLVSCKKDIGTTMVPPPPGGPSAPVLLKDIVIPRLPSPFYHFEYDATGRASFVSFASGFTMYNIVYSGNNISEMRNNIIVNKDRLQYVYDNEDRVLAVKYADSAGIVYKRIIFSYDGQKLFELERQQKSGTGFIIEKTMKFSYYADGNLEEIAYHYLPFNGQPEQIYSDRFEQYDNKINVDGFALIHNDFFDHLVLLPGVILQKNNRGKQIHTGDGVNYEVNYTYTYNDKNLPLEQRGELTFTTGPDTGKKFQTSSMYSYY